MLDIKKNTAQSSGYSRFLCIRMTWLRRELRVALSLPQWGQT